MKVKLLKGSSSPIEVKTTNPQIAAERAGQSWFGSVISGAKLVAKRKSSVIYELMTPRGSMPTGTRVEVEFSAEEREAAKKVGAV